MALTSNSKDSSTRERPKPTLSKWIFCVIACLCTIAFVIWTGYFIMLIMLPVFFDIYITKFVPWGTWKNVKNPALKVVLDWVDAILFALVAVYFINTFFFQNYQIPSSSLEKSLLVGDFLCVSKLSYGARSPMTPLALPLMQHTIPWLDTKSYFDKPQLDYKRFGSGKVERNDIVVFNYPSGDSVLTKFQNADYYHIKLQVGRDEIVNNPNRYGELIYRPVDRRENYVKRCVGLPGDTIEFIDDVTYINGEAQHIPENRQLKYVVQTNGMPIPPAMFDQLEISEDDRVYRSMEYPSASVQDSLILTQAGLKMNDGKDVLLYSNVFLTQDKVDLLSKQPYVLKIVTQNEFYNNTKTKRDMIGNAVYPMEFYADKSVRFGDFPALWIPKRGETIKFDTNVDYKVAAYERCIKNYEFNDFEYKDGKVYINGQEASEYTFKLDYYFMAGDNRDNSADSRTWGFVPEDHIVGSPLFIWLSLDKDKGWFDGKIRWSRLFTSGNKNK